MLAYCTEFTSDLFCNCITLGVKIKIGKNKVISNQKKTSQNQFPSTLTFLINIYPNWSVFHSYSPVECFLKVSALGLTSTARTQAYPPTVGKSLLPATSIPVYWTSSMVSKNNERKKKITENTGGNKSPALPSSCFSLDGKSQHQHTFTPPKKTLR